MHNTSTFMRALTALGVAVGSAVLIAVVAFAIRGAAPALAAPPAGATTLTLHTLQTSNSSSRAIVKQLDAWHAPRIPAIRHVAPPPPRVVTVTAPPTVIAAPPQPATQPQPAPVSAAPVTAAPTKQHEPTEGDGHDD